MKLNPTHQNILNAAIIIIIVVIAFAAYQTPKIDVHGIFLPQTDQTFQSTSSNSIQVVSNVPINGQYIGLINTALHYANNKPKTISNVKNNPLIMPKNSQQKLEEILSSLDTMSLKDQLDLWIVLL